MMDGTLKGVLTLVRSAILCRGLPLPEEFDLELAYPVIRGHQIFTLAYDGAVRCGIDKSHPRMQQLFRKYCQAMAVSERQMQAIETLCGKLDEDGIDYMPLKGCNLKKLYPKPELRLMGDADILIRTEQYDRIMPIVRFLGYEEQVESDHEFVWQSDALFLELHKRLIPSYNQDYYRYFGDGWRLAVPVSGSRYGMIAEDEFIYLFTHFAKHYRDGGIGIRHAADLWVYLRTHPALDEGYVIRQLDQLQLTVFYKNIRKLLDVWFEDGMEDEKTAFLSEFLYESGNWGKMYNHVLSAGVKNIAVTGKNGGERSRRIISGFFPSLSIMQEKYPILYKLPFLLPVFWIIRWITAVLFRRDNLRRQKQILQISSKENIESYQQALNYVGLDFHFEE